MGELREKLNDRRGATMLMALLLLTVAVMVSAVVIPAALTNAKRLKTERTQQQAYLTVSSAAELLLDALNGQEYVAVEERTETATVSVSAETPQALAEQGDIADWQKIGAHFEKEAEFQPLLTEAMARLPYHEAAAGSYEKHFTLSAEGLQTVEVDFTMEPDYDVTALLELSGDGGGRYRMYLTLTGTLTGPVNETSSVSETVTTVENVTTTTTTTVSTREFIIRWSNPGVGKGAAPT